MNNSKYNTTIKASITLKIERILSKFIKFKKQ